MTGSMCYLSSHRKASFTNTFASFSTQAPHAQLSTCQNPMKEVVPVIGEQATLLRERQPNVEPHATIRVRGTERPEHGVADRPASDHCVSLDEISQDHGARLSVEEEHFPEERIAFESELLEVQCSQPRLGVSVKTSLTATGISPRVRAAFPGAQSCASGKRACQLFNLQTCLCVETIMYLTDPNLLIC